MSHMRCSQCHRPIAALDVYDPRPSGPVCSTCMLGQERSEPQTPGPDQEGRAPGRVPPNISWSGFLDILAG